jgi:hypothetical protein
MVQNSRLVLRRPLGTAFLLAVLVGGTVLLLGLSSASGGSGSAREVAPASVAPVVAGSVTGGVDERAVATVGETFFKATISRLLFNCPCPGELLLSGSRDGRASTLVNDVLSLKIVHEDSTTSSYTHDYSNGCRSNPLPLPPTDLSAKFNTGVNKVTATLKDKCGGSVSSTALWLGPPRHIYWTDEFESQRSMWRANLDGTGDQPFTVGGAFHPHGVAVDANYIYWANPSSIGRANLDGTLSNPTFISGASTPFGVAVDANYIYWTNVGTNTVGRANLDGTGVNQSFISGADGPKGVAVDVSHIYWTNSNINTIGRANLNGTGVDQSFISGADRPTAVAVDTNYIYWVNNAATTNTIGRANLAGTDVNQSFIICLCYDGVAVDTG